MFLSTPKRLPILTAVLLTSSILASSITLAADSIKLGLLHPTTGRYKAEGYEQAQGALLAVEEINQSGGLLGKPLELLMADTASKVEHAATASHELLAQGAEVLLGGISSDVVIEIGQTAAEQHVLYLPTLGTANEITEEKGNRYLFREYASAHMTAQALAFYLNQNIQDKKLFFVTADYSWGNSTEASIRTFTHTTDTASHPGVKVPFPRPRQQDLQAALDSAAASDADILILVQFGEDMATALELADSMDLKEHMQIVVPNLTESMAASAGASLMENVVGTTPWTWSVPYQYGYPRGKAFVEDYVERFHQYPGSVAAAAYDSIYQYRDAASRAGTTNSDRVIKALEDHSYSLLKDPQQWRAFDHQNIQSVYVVRGKPRDTVMQSELRSDYFEILLNVPGNSTARSQDEWLEIRQQAGKAGHL